MADKIGKEEKQDIEENPITREVSAAINAWVASIDRYVRLCTKLIYSAGLLAIIVIIFISIQQIYTIHRWALPKSILELNDNQSTVCIVYPKDKELSKDTLVVIDCKDIKDTLKVWGILTILR